MFFSGGVVVAVTDRKARTWLCLIVALSLFALAWPAQSRADPASNYRSAVLADNPLSYWRLNETSGTTAADQQNQNPGTIQGRVTLGQPGPMSGDLAMAFDGTSGVVDMGPSSSIDSTLLGSYSVEFWISSTSTAVERVLGKFVGPGCNAGPCLFTALLNVAAGQLSFYTGDGADPEALISDRSDLNDGAWHYIVVERDASTSPATQRMYIDGQLDSTRTESLAPASDSNSFQIGHDGSSYAEYYDGDLAEIAIYNHVLSASQVAAHYAASGRSLPSRQIDLYAPVQESARICGTNQRDEHVCHVFDTEGAQDHYKLSGWWWRGTVKIENFLAPNGQRQVDATRCTIPSGGSGTWANCNGFSWASAYDTPYVTDAPGSTHYPASFYRFHIPRLGASYGVVTMAFFISSKYVPLLHLNLGWGDNRGFTTNGFPAPDRARVEFVLDYDAGVGIMRINPSCGLPPLGCGGPNPIVAQSPLPWGSATLAATNYVETQKRDPASPGSSSLTLLKFGAVDGGAHPVGAWLAGEIDAAIVLKSEPDGNFKASFSLKAFPSTEVYHEVKDATGAWLQVREAGWNASDPIDTNPDLSPLSSYNFQSYTVCTDPTQCG